MEEMLWRRRVAVAASVLALGGFGVAAAGCGDDNGDSEDIENAADDAVQEGEDAAEDSATPLTRQPMTPGKRSRAPRTRSRTTTRRRRARAKAQTTTAIEDRFRGWTFAGALS